MRKKYFQILGLPEKSSLNEIKKAYRKKALQLHPDVNKSPDAQNQFIELNEAYAYFSQPSFQQKRTHSQYPRSRQNWDIKKEQARQRAKAHAQMKHQEFLKSDIYKTSESLNVLVNFIIAIVLSFLLIGFPIIAYLQEGKQGFLISFLIIIVTYKLWSTALFGKHRLIRTSEFLSAFNHLRKLESFQLGLMLIFNFLVLTQIGFNTFINISLLIILYLTGLFGGLLFSFMTKKSFLKKSLLFGIGPGVISLFFLLNFTFSHSPNTEVYRFRFEETTSVNQTPFIILANNKYQEVYNTRFFFDMFQQRGARVISYSFAEGLFGLRVIKDHEFGHLIK